MSKTELSSEDVWQRSPFSLAEQLKILLIFVDGLPFRSTQRGYPNRLDVSEASALVNWPEEHLHWLIHRALELGLINTKKDRFYMTEAVTGWEQGQVDVSLSESQIPFHQPLEGGVTEQVTEEEGSLFRSMQSLLTQLQPQESRSVSDLREELPDDSPVFRSPPGEAERDSLLRDRLWLAYHLGWIDVRTDEDEIESVQLNERGLRWMDEGVAPDASPRIDQSLPVILQPDGQLMIPLESPLEVFRRAHPFVLLTGIDNMVKYSMDQRSLVNAENEGWDTGAFRSFLEDETGSLPETVAALFQESDQDAERIRVEEVYHLLEFERGATAAEAMRVLGNYQPERIDENRIILRSSTTPETIKKNLSRSGIRIQMDSGSHHRQSPLLPVEEPAE